MILQSALAEAEPEYDLLIEDIPTVMRPQQQLSRQQFEAMCCCPSISSLPWPPPTSTSSLPPSISSQIHLCYPRHSLLPPFCPPPQQPHPQSNSQHGGYWLPHVPTTTASSLPPTPTLSTWQVLGRCWPATTAGGGHGWAGDGHARCWPAAAT